MNEVPPIQAWNAAPLAGRVVLVTGGAQGIGRGIAQAVLGAGGSVLIGDLDAEAGAECLRDWDVGERARFRSLDVLRESSVSRFIDGAIHRFSRIDGLVNNAGIADPDAGPVTGLSWSDWNRRLSSLHGAFLCSKHALPALREHGGAIVNIASTRALQSEPDSEAYAASKGGLLALTHALAVSAGPSVRVNGISPGWIAVEDWKKSAERAKPKLRRVDHAQHPVGRVGVPEDIATLAVYLLANALSGFVTGQTFTVDGGMTRKMQYA
jgi:hypothetical protein